MLVPRLEVPWIRGQKLLGRLLARRVCRAGFHSRVIPWQLLRSQPRPRTVIGLAIVPMPMPVPVPVVVPVIMDRAICLGLC